VDRFKAEGRDLGSGNGTSLMALGLRLHGEWLLRVQ